VLALRLKDESSGPRAQGPGVAVTGFGGETKFAGPWTLDAGPWMLFGLLWGLIALSNASLLLVFPATIVWILFPAKSREEKHATGFERGILGATAACMVFALTLLPWVLRNERTMHAFIPTRDNFGVELYQSSLFYHDIYEWGQAVPLDTRNPDYKLYASMGEVAYSHMRGEQGKANLRARQGMFLKLTAERVEGFWIGIAHPVDRHPVGEWLRLVNYCFLSAAGLMGLGLMLRRRVPGAWLFAAVFGLVPLAYYVVTVQARFRHPIEPLMAVLTVYLFRSTSAANPDLQKREIGGTRIVQHR